MGGSQLTSLIIIISRWGVTGSSRETLSSNTVRHAFKMDAEYVIVHFVIIMLL